MKCRILMALLLTSAFFASLAQILSPTQTLAQNAPTLDETAHFLAGMPVTGVLEPLTHDPACQEHGQAMNEARTRKEQQQSWAMSQWKEGKVPQYHRSNVTVVDLVRRLDFCCASLIVPLSRTTGHPQH